MKFRMELGAFIIKEKLGIRDRETVEKIKENPYLQQFIGVESYKDQDTFDASILVHFIEKIGAYLINKINLYVVKNQSKNQEDEVKKTTLLEKIKECKNQSKLIIDATCALSDINYLMHLNLLNNGRIKTEII